MAIEQACMDRTNAALVAYLIAVKIVTNTAINHLLWCWWLFAGRALHIDSPMPIVSSKYA